MSKLNNTTTPLEAGFVNNRIELERSVLLVIYGSLGLLAVLSNVSLCAVLLRNLQMLQQAYNIIIFALAMVDTLTGKLRKTQVRRHMIILVQF